MYNIRQISKLLILKSGYKNKFAEFLRPLQYQSQCNVQCFRFVSQRSQKFIQTEENWKIHDGLSNYANWKLIYKAPLYKSFKFATTFLSLITFGTIIAGIYYAFFVFSVNNMYEPLKYRDIVIADNVIQGFILYGSLFAFIISTKILCSKIVVRLYKNGDNYIAIYKGHWYNHVKAHKFHIDEFVPLKPTHIVPWGTSRFGLGKRHGILLETYFKTPQYFNNLLYKKKNSHLDDVE